MAKETGDDNLGDVRGVGTTAGHTHHSEQQLLGEIQCGNSVGERSKREMNTHKETGTETKPVGSGVAWRGVAILISFSLDFWEKKTESFGFIIWVGSVYLLSYPFC